MANTMSTLIERLEELNGIATAAPWSDRGYVPEHGVNHTIDSEHEPLVASAFMDEDATLIVEVRNLLPVLVKILSAYHNGLSFIHYQSTDFSDANSAAYHALYCADGYLKDAEARR